MQKREPDGVDRVGPATTAVTTRGVGYWVGVVAIMAAQAAGWVGLQAVLAWSAGEAIAGPRWSWAALGAHLGAIDVGCALCGWVGMMGLELVNRLSEFDDHAYLAEWRLWVRDPERRTRAAQVLLVLFGIGLALNECCARTLSSDGVTVARQAVLDVLYDGGIAWVGTAVLGSLALSLPVGAVLLVVEWLSGDVRVVERGTEDVQEAVNAPPSSAGNDDFLVALGRDLSDVALSVVAGIALCIALCGVVHYAEWRTPIRF